MTGFWLWLAVAGSGAPHGLNPASGWLFAAALAMKSGDGGQARRALLPIAAGHTASVALVAVAVAFGLSMDRVALQVMAGMLLIAVAVFHVASNRFRAPAAHAGLMLVPALIPLCMDTQTAGEISATDVLLPALVAVAVHTAAMLTVTGVIAVLVCRGFNAGAGFCKRLICP